MLGSVPQCSVKFTCFSVEISRNSPVILVNYSHSGRCKFADNILSKFGLQRGPSKLPVSFATIRNYRHPRAPSLDHDFPLVRLFYPTLRNRFYPFLLHKMLLTREVCLSGSRCVCSAFSYSSSSGPHKSILHFATQRNCAEEQAQFKA